MLAEDELAEPVTAPARPDDAVEPDRRLRIALAAALAVASLTCAGTVGWLAGAPQPGGLGVRWVRRRRLRADMSTHHQQTVTMSGYERDNTSNPSLKLLAYNVEDTQSVEIGEMQGRLDGWGLER